MPRWLCDLFTPTFFSSIKVRWTVFYFLSLVFPVLVATLLKMYKRQILMKTFQLSKHLKFLIQRPKKLYLPLAPPFESLARKFPRKLFNFGHFFSTNIHFFIRKLFAEVSPPKGSINLEMRTWTIIIYRGLTFFIRSSLPAGPESWTCSIICPLILQIMFLVANLLAPFLPNQRATKSWKCDFMTSPAAFLWFYRVLFSSNNSTFKLLRIISTCQKH